MKLRCGGCLLPFTLYCLCCESPSISSGVLICAVRGRVLLQLQRVTNNLKNARLQMASLSDTLLDVEKQRDVFRYILQHKWVIYNGIIIGVGTFYRLKLANAKQTLSQIPNAPNIGLDDVDEKGTC